MDSSIYPEIRTSLRDKRDLRWITFFRRQQYVRAGHVCISFGALMACEAVVVLCVDDEIAGSLIRCCTTNNIVTIIFLFIPYILILFSSSFVFDSFLLVFLEVRLFILSCHSVHWYWLSTAAVAGHCHWKKLTRSSNKWTVAKKGPGNDNVGDVAAEGKHTTIFNFNCQVSLCADYGRWAHSSAGNVV